jgi:hypothetical protein
MHYTSSCNIQKNLSIDKDDNFANIYHNKGFLTNKNYDDDQIIKWYFKEDGTYVTSSMSWTFRTYYLNTEIQHQF